MMPAKLNQELFDHQEDTVVLTFYADGKPEAQRRFKPGGYSEALTWASAKYREGLGWTLEVQTLAVNNNTVKALRADGEVR